MELMVSARAATSPLASTVIFWERSPRATAVVTWVMLRTWLVRLPAMKFTESVRSFHVPLTPGTSAWPPSLPSVPTSRATVVTCSAKIRRVSVMELMVSARAATSPLAATVIFWERSPRATAADTWAMFRTWVVRFPAMKFTESVSSRHVPDTPLTWAWPPSLPSVPTSRATRVTSSAKDPSWSTMVLMVFLRARISPRASTVIFCDRSPLATAVVTWAMLRTWLVRLPASSFTESVRFFHVPETPLTLAWPPSLPSVPTSLATRVTSLVNEPSWSTMPLTTVPMRANSPFTGWPSMVRDIFWVRSPWATACSTRATSLVGRTRSSMRRFTESTQLSHDPPAPSRARRSVMRPSRPTTRPTRPRSLLRRALRSATRLKALATCPARPLPRVDMRTVKSPLPRASSASRTSARRAPSPSLCGRPRPRPGRSQPGRASTARQQ